MPGSARAHHREQSAYQATSNRLSMGSVVSASSQVQLPIPTISTTPDINKSLPAPPVEADRRSRTPAALRSFLRSQSSGNHLDPSQLQPELHTQPQRFSSAAAHLSVDVHSHNQRYYSRSMPNSPYQQSYDYTTAYPPPLDRVQSAHPAFPDIARYQPYSITPDFPHPESSLSSHFEASPTQSRTFPETIVVNSTARGNVSNRPRPHTWLSPTEPFDDASQVHLFVEATTGLPNDTDPWSPNGPNRLQGSLFARRPSNSTTCAPSQYIPAPIPDRTHQTASWQSFEPPFVPSRSVSAPMSSVLPQDTRIYQSNLTPHINDVNAELEMLGLEQAHSSDDELPDYAQSQAEMNARKREEAAARARDLEARWRGARGRRT
ncbi:hypothetical protein EJ07DRAFT_152115 [Lizonia empirigonia]|nr:hypothetical protein EJ07DRAFT_152115 [Lizonia empirigonia]